MTVGAVTLAGVEKVLVSNFDTNTDDTEDHDFNTALWTGVTTLGLSSSAAEGDTKFSNVAAIATAEMKNGAGDLEIDYAAAAVAGTTDTQTLVLDAVSAGTFTADAGIETVAITAASTASASTLTDLVATGATKITIDSDVALTITNALDATAVTVDGSASAGALSLNFTAATADLAVTGGTGNDTFTFDATGTLTTADTISGGDGTDTIKNISAQFEALDGAVMTKVTGIEALAITDDATAAETLTTASFGSITKVTLEEDTAGAYGVTFATGGGTVVLGAGAAGDGGTDALGGALTITASGTATTDAATFQYGTATADSAGNNLATSGVETLTINNTKAADTIGTITMSSVSTGGASKVVFTGDKTMTVGVVTAATVDASALTSTAALVMTGASVGATSITGSANGDTLYGIAASASTIDGGAGNDSITGGSAADNVTAGAGNDTVVGAGGNDVITGGDGNDSIDVSGAAGAVNVNGGAGNDTITLNGTITATDTLAGGDGTDTLVINATDITALNGMTFGDGSTLNANMSGIEKVKTGALATSGTSTNILDMSRLDNINYVIVSAAGVAATQISGMVDASTVEITGDLGDTDVLTLAYASTTGTQSLTIKANYTGSADLGSITAAGIENVTVNSTTSNATPSGVTNTLGLTIAAATTLTVTGDAILDANESAINATTIDASANTAGFHVLGGSANQTITGTAAADNIDGGAGADTISGGAGADTLAGGTGADSITAGEGADTVTGGAGNDTIVLTETTAAVDDVVIDYSEAGAYIDTVVGFATTSSGDEIQLDLSALETAGTSGVHSSAVNFQALNADTDAAAGAATVQVLTTAAASAGGANVFVLSGATFSSAAEVEDAIESGGAFQIGVSTTGADLAVDDAFIVVYSNGTDAKVAAVRIVTDPSTNGVFAAGATDVIDLVTLTGVSSIGSTTFAAGNFEWIA